jgi:hypothetical protein
VLIAAGFEAFFTETMRIAWRESFLDLAAFDRMIARNIAITSLVDWLPATVGRPGLRDAPGNLHARWEEMVNRRRNQVMHQANVHFNSDESRASLRVALECIAFCDEAALVRPHVYYLTQ